MPDRFCEFITSFPDFSRNGFNIEEYNRKFLLSNVVIHAKTKSIEYPEHWGPLSLKCAFNGNEYFRVNGGKIAINNKNYLILNEGNYYSSCIDSEAKVESFSINFSPALSGEMATGLLETDDFNMCNYGYERRKVLFGEQLYVFDDTMTGMIRELRNIIIDPSPQKMAIEYLYRKMLGHLFRQQRQLNKNIGSVPKIRLSTQRELYKRLTRAKDYIDSCYDRDLSLDELAGVCYLNSSYFLRQFKNYYKVTPRQYLIGKRMQDAKEQLESGKRLPITDICAMVGYSDLSSFSKLLNNIIPVHRNDTEASTASVSKGLTEGLPIQCGSLRLITVIVCVWIVGMIGPVANHTAAEQGSHESNQGKYQNRFLFHNGYFKQLNRCFIPVY